MYGKNVQPHTQYNLLSKIKHNVYIAKMDLVWVELGPENYNNSMMAEVDAFMIEAYYKLKLEFILQKRIHSME